MNKVKYKKAGLARRKRRVRGKVSGTSERPRLCVTRTNMHIYAQIIDDVSGVTIAAASTIDKDLRSGVSYGANADAAKAVGEAVARRATEKGVTEVIFDRSGRLYHGRVKSLADGARSAGLKF